MKYARFLALSPLVFMAGLAWAEPASLTLNDYLNQVRSDNPAFRASLETQRGFPLQSWESHLVYSPNLYADINYLDDRKEGASAMQAERTRSADWNVELSNLFPSGTKLSASYGVDYMHQYMPASSSLPPSIVNGLFASLPYYDAAPSISISQSLCRDFMGISTRAGVSRDDVIAKASELSERYRSKQMEFQAEQTYWNLAYARIAVDFSRSLLGQARKLSEWTEKKAVLHLIEEIDLLQIRANLKVRENNLRIAEQNLLSVARNFNALRNTGGEVVDEELEDIKGRATLTAGFSLTKGGDRLDVQTSRLFLKAAELNAKMALNRALPAVNAFGTLTLNGHAGTSRDAGEASLEGEHPTYLVGVTVSAPLGVKALKSTIDGYGMANRAAKHNLEQAIKDAEKDWGEAVQNWSDTKASLVLAMEIEDIQGQKYLKGMDGFHDGKTSMFQLLSFSEDYLQAQLNSLQLARTLLILDAQARLYNAR